MKFSDKKISKIISLIFTIIIILIAAFELLPSEKNQPAESAQTSQESQAVQSPVTFRNKELLNEHYEKHGIEMGFPSAAEYEKAAAAVVSNPKSLHKTEEEDGDDVYYLEDTNEFVIVSTDGYIRTYFYPDKGIKYFNGQ